MLKIIITTTLISFAVSAPRDLDFSPVNQFALQLLENAYAHQESYGSTNVAISPISVWSIFALLAEASTGDTLDELVRSLHLPNDSHATQYLHKSVRNFLNRKHKGNNGVTLKGQQAIFTDRTLQIHKEFCDSALAYDTDIYSVDPRNTTKLANDINLYVCLATQGLIMDVVQPRNLENLRMIIVDALFFKARWTHPFDQVNTKQAPFYSAKGKQIGSVNMMFHKAPHSILDSEELEAQVLEMTYGTMKDFSMIILLPFDGTPMKRMLANLAKTDSKQWLSELILDETETEVYMPRFRLSGNLQLIDPLKYTGVYSIFESSKAELPGISDTPMFVSTAIQKVEVEVTEEGTTAAAATVVGVENRILNEPFKINKEFVFLILERNSQSIVFAGVYSEPSLY